MTKIKKPHPENHLTVQQRRFVLRSIAEFKTSAWIRKELLARWDVDRAEGTLEQTYRYNPLYREQIAKYRAAFNAREREHPLFNRQVQLSYLQAGMEIAIEDRDGKALASLIKQAADITGTSAPTELEITHHNGSQDFETLLKSIQKPEQNQTIDTVLDPLSPIPLPAQILETNEGNPSQLPMDR